jgi:hypothetical protein
MPKSTPTDPLRARLLELLEEITQHQNQLRDFASIPGNAWLAKGELQTITTLISDLEALLEDLKKQDAENGYS